MLSRSGKARPKSSLGATVVRPPCQELHLRTAPIRTIASSRDASTFELGEVTRTAELAMPGGWRTVDVHRGPTGAFCRAQTSACGRRSHVANAGGIRTWLAAGLSRFQGSHTR